MKGDILQQHQADQPQPALHDAEPAEQGHGDAAQQRRLVARLALVPKARFDVNVVNMRDPTTESVQAFMQATIEVESSPPERNTPRGTSDIRRHRTAELTVSRHVLA